MLFNKRTIQYISSSMEAVASCMFTHNVGVTIILFCLVISVGSQTFWWQYSYVSFIIVDYTFTGQGSWYYTYGSYMQLNKRLLPLL